MEIKKPSILIKSTLLLLWWLLPLASMQLFSNQVPFQQENYFNGSHHFIPDSRIGGHPFNLITNLAVWDAQWYLKIASSGYPHDPNPNLISDRKNMDVAVYAFFPLYPSLIALINASTQNVLVAAWVGMLSSAVILSILWLEIITRLFSQSVAYKSLLFTLSLPTSLFLRSYFTESLQLIFLLLFIVALYSKKFTLLTCIAVISFFIKGNNIALIIFNLFWLFINRKHASLSQWLITISIITGSIVTWLLFNLHQTGDALFFLSARKAWNLIDFPLGILINPFIIGQTFYHPFQHFFHVSHIDSLTALITGILLVKSRNQLPKTLWLISFLIWITPLASSDVMSFSRYQLVNIPLLIYVTRQIPTKLFPIVIGGLFLITLYLSPYFVNWHWFG